METVGLLLLLCCVSDGGLASKWISSSSSKIHRVIRSSSDEEVDDNTRSKRSIPTDDMAKKVVDMHNEYRGIIGEEQNEPEPANMKFMTWDESLAYNSLWYAKKCVFEHSVESERQTAHFPVYNGENLWAGQGDFKDNFDPRVGITSWFDEYVDYEFDTEYCTPGMMCGHYTQVVWADSYKLGCAWTICDKFDTTMGEIWTDAAYMVCHYAPGGNIGGLKLYEVGPRCSKCAENDTCPDGKLCRNEIRDKLLPGPHDTGEIIAVTLVCLVLATAFSIAAYYFYKHRETLLLTWRNRRKISNHGVNDTATTETRNGDATTQAENS